MFLKKKFPVKTVATNQYEDDRLADGLYSGEEYSHHRYSGRTVERCVYERCKFSDLRMWRTTISDSRFSDCSLRDAALGGLQNGEINKFHRVTFERTDLRGTAWSSAEMLDCQFIDCRLDRVDFQGVRFVGCMFVGELREVMFYDHGFGVTDQPRNEMLNCDFSRAELRLVAFRRLDLPSVVPPLPANGYTVTNYRDFLKTAISCASEDETKFKKMMQHFLKWAGPRQEQGFFGLTELEDWLGSHWRRRIGEIQMLASSRASL